MKEAEDEAKAAKVVKSKSRTAHKTPQISSSKHSSALDGPNYYYRGAETSKKVHSSSKAKSLVRRAAPVDYYNDEIDDFRTEPRHDEANQGDFYLP